MCIMDETEYIIIYVHQVLITKQYDIQKFKLTHCNNFYTLLKTIDRHEKIFSRYNTYHFVPLYYRIQHVRHKRIQHIRSTYVD